MAEDVVVVVVVTISKVNCHTRVDTEDAEHVEDVVIHIKCATQRLWKYTPRN